MNADLKNDVYFSEEYARLYLCEGEEIFQFIHSEGARDFTTIGIKRPITKIGGENVDEGYFDLETAYGYGGYLTNSDDPDFVVKAMNLYREECAHNRIIAEFVRFHPFNSYPLEFSQTVDFCTDDRQVAYVDLTKSYDDIRSGYASSLKRNLNKCSKFDLTFKEVGSIIASRFIELYEQTMRRHQASDFYLFGEEYFKRLDGCENVRMYSVEDDGVDINYIVVLESAPFAYYHLGATDAEHYRLNPNPFIFDALIKRYKEKGFEIFYFGGGSTQAPDDSLLRFKKKFTDLTKDFYIGGNIFIPDVYNRYITMRENQSPELWDLRYFLKYRWNG